MTHLFQTAVSELSSPPPLSLICGKSLASPQSLSHLLLCRRGCSAVVQATPWMMETLAVAVTVVTCLDSCGESHGEEEDEDVMLT